MAGNNYSERDRGRDGESAVVWSWVVMATMKGRLTIAHMAQASVIVGRRDDVVVFVGRGRDGEET